MIFKRLKANAKINLGLNILRKNKNGYHDLDMIMAPINLVDILEIKFYEKKGNLKILSNNHDVPLGSDNIIFKIYQKYYRVTGLQMEDIEVYLDKRIPSQAGLGGGSSDAAFFLKALNKYHNNLLDQGDMIELSKNIGADIPFFLINKTARVQGIGEKLELIENNLDKNIILIKPDFGICTAKAYKAYSLLKKKKWSDIDKVVMGLSMNNLEIVNKNIENHLQQSALFLDDRIKSFEEKLMNIDTNFKMSGSGSCYYLISERGTSELIYERLVRKFDDCFISQTDFI